MATQVEENGRGSADAVARPDAAQGEDAPPNPLQAVPKLVGGAIGGIARRIADAVPSADLDTRDTDYIREPLPGLWMLASICFRAYVRGLHHVPKEGPILLVGNHSGGIMAPDLFVFVLAFSTYFGVERRFR